MLGEELGARGGGAYSSFDLEFVAPAEEAHDLETEYKEERDEECGGPM